MSSIVADQTQLQASTQQSTSSAIRANASSAANTTNAPTVLPAGVSVQQLTQTDGTVIKEFLSNGSVFGIAWRGPTPPNLRQLLGNYFPAYAAGIQSANQNGERGPIAFQAAGMVVSTGGHMNSFFGQAFLPALLPQGVTAQAIQ
ncbi:hypothetical protein GGD40_003419 [Paraburkholderia bryophila]|uniref:DUF2844 domain-containing protein n=2 Tax=Paraburkholderia TaxID=1822464 RepID=A0A7Y9WPE9_9BURK|nr:hypothetical protein [Paraburkholderia bryophila]